MRSFFWKLHRYVGLFLAPVFAIILISGLFLTMKPMLAPTYSNMPLGDRAEQAFQAVQAAEQQGASISSFALDVDGKRFWSVTDKKSPLKAFSLENGELLGKGGVSNEMYGFMKKLHKEIFINKIISEIAAYAMAIMILVGLIFMVRPQFRKDLLSWHNGLGVWAWIVWAMLPITAIMMTLHIGAPKIKLNKEAQKSVLKIMQALNDENRLSELVAVDSMKGSTIIRLSENGQIKTVQLIQNEVSVPRNKNGQIEEEIVILNDWQTLNTATYWPKVLHEGTWGGKTSAIINFLATLGLLFFLFSGCYTWLKRRMRQNAEAGQVLPINTTDKARFLVAYATQTGNAEKLAKQTQKHLQQHNISADVASTAAVKAEHLDGYENVLLIVSTTGEGELPATAHALEKSLLNSQLKQANVALLALGDKYFTQFCGGGKKIEAALKQAGAQFILPTRLVSGKPFEDWKTWLGELGQQFNFPAPILEEIISTDVATQATLIQRTRLDKPEFNTREVGELLFRLPENITFKGGDLMTVTPPNSKTERTYSIGSDSQDGNEVRLTVGLNTFLDSEQQLQKGKGSDWLLHQLNIGDTIDVNIRQHPSFTIIENDDRPVIMVAVGTGIAPLVGFIPALKRHQRDAWLFFGNAHREACYLHQNLWETAQKEGVVTRINTIFDNEQKGYVQDEILRYGKEIYEWIAKRQAIVYVCGRESTVGKGTERALAQIFQEYSKCDEKVAMEKVEQLKAEQALRMDLFG